MQTREGCAGADPSAEGFGVDWETELVGSS